MGFSGSSSSKLLKIAPLRRIRLKATVKVVKKRIRRVAVDLVPAPPNTFSTTNLNIVPLNSVLPPSAQTSTPTKTSAPIIPPPSTSRHAHPTPSNTTAVAAALALYTEMLLECEAYCRHLDPRYSQVWSMDMFDRAHPTFWRRELFENFGEVLSPATVARAAELAAGEAAKFSASTPTAPTTSPATSVVNPAFSNTPPKRKCRSGKRMK